MRACQRSARLRQGEGAQEVGHGEAQALVVFPPRLGWVMLARGTVPVLTRMVAVMVASTLLTGRELAPQSLGAASLHVGHGSQRSGRHPLTALSPVWGAREAEDVSKLNQDQ